MHFTLIWMFSNQNQYIDILQTYLTFSSSFFSLFSIGSINPVAHIRSTNFIDFMLITNSYISLFLSFFSSEIFINILIQLSLDSHDSGSWVHQCEQHVKWMTDDKKNDNNELKHTHTHTRMKYQCGSVVRVSDGQSLWFKYLKVEPLLLLPWWPNRGHNIRWNNRRETAIINNNNNNHQFQKRHLDRMDAHPYRPDLHWSFQIRHLHHCSPQIVVLNQRNRQHRRQQQQQQHQRHRRQVSTIRTLTSHHRTTYRPLVNNRHHHHNLVNANESSAKWSRHRKKPNVSFTAWRCGIQFVDFVLELSNGNILFTTKWIENE